MIELEREHLVAAEKHKPEEIVANLREIDVLLSQGPLGRRSGSHDRRDAVYILPLVQGVRCKLPAPEAFLSTAPPEDRHRHLPRR